MTLTFVILTGAATWTDKATAIGTLVVAGGVAVAAAGAWLTYGQLKETRKQLEEVRSDRHVQVLSDLGRRWDEQLLWEARVKQFDYTDEQLADLVGRWFETQDSSARDVPLMLRVPNFFEDISVMVEAGQLELEYVARTMRSLAYSQWNFWQPSIKKMREDTPASYVEFEKLVESLKEHSPN